MASGIFWTTSACFSVHSGASLSISPELLLTTQVGRPALLTVGAVQPNDPSVSKVLR